MIKGDRIYLRDINLDDLDTLHRWVNDTETTRWLLIDPPVSREAERAWVERLPHTPDHKTFMICESCGTPIGTLHMGPIIWKHFSAQVGISIFESTKRGCGYGTEAMELLLRYAFDAVGLHRVELFVFAGNEKAMRSYEKCGFVTEGLVRECYLKDGRYIDAFLMSILAPDWKERQKKANATRNE